MTNATTQTDTPATTPAGPGELPVRTSYVSAHVRPATLVPHDVILFDGEWREVADVWQDGDLEAALGTVGEDDPHAADLRKRLRRSDGQYVAVRYWLEHPDPDEVTAGLVWLRSCQLVIVQVPAGQVPYPDMPVYRRAATDDQADPRRAPEEPREGSHDPEATV